ncbi:MAG: hypothetical protein WC801_03100 [Patescibacteria group bacterium]|jgi:intracellular sulfur oxidation DsrE/DsrF family protein
MKRVLVILGIIIIIAAIFFVTIGKPVAIKLLNRNTAAEHVVLVPGYGAPVSGNKTYEGYIENVANYVFMKENQVTVVIFTGSYSVLSELSEAEAMNQYFNSSLDITALQQRGVRVYQERCAITSAQNISYSKDLLDEHKIFPERVTIFGDSAHKDKLVATAEYEFSGASIDFQGYSLGAQANLLTDVKDLTELVTGYDSAKNYNKVLQERIKQWSTSYHYDVAANLVAKGCTQYKGFQ